MYVKDMKRTDWQRILERAYAERDFVHNGARARESLMLIKRASAPLSVQSGSEVVKVVDNGYFWLQTAVEGEFVWLTAMFDENGELLQIYFDITAGNCFDDPENPTFEDMYLDVVLTTRGEICMLDEDELDEALAAGDITQEEYEHAKDVCKRLCDWLSEYKAETIEYCESAFERLREEICLKFEK